MATIVFTALGTALGGPLGGALGSLVGNSIDRSVAGGRPREGARLRELGVSASSYGSPIPRHHGTVRAPGVIVWATDLVERSQTSGGGKGSPRTTTYSYTVSFAVALSSRPIVGVGRVWADGNLLRGAGGDLKTGGTFRLYRGRGDEDPDPLIASAQAPAPAFRGLAYCVFENLALGDFGNRIPALTFEIVADPAPVGLAELLQPVGEPLSLDRPLDGLQGFSLQGGSLADSLDLLDQVYPLACDAGGERLSLRARDASPAAPPLLPPPATAGDVGESFAAQTGVLRRRRPETEAVPDGLRYYDPARDFQPGLQQAEGRARPGRKRVIEFPGVLAATDARALVDRAASRATASRDTIAWRTAEIDPALGPGQIVRVPGHGGLWSIDAWEWRAEGVELELRRLPRGSASGLPADPGQAWSAPDLVIAETDLVTYELPWDGLGSGDTRQVFAACSSSSPGWRGAELFLVQESDLVPLGTSGRRPSILGTSASALPGSPGALLERQAWLDVDLASDAMALDGATPEALAGGANKALVGSEILQFVRAERVEGRRWRLSGLLRGRGATEAAALAGAAAGARFVLLDERPAPLDAAKVATSGPATIAALGPGDSAPVLAPLVNPGLSRRPLTPVHGAVRAGAEGSTALSWCRRARGAWAWPDGIDAPLAEQAEAYTVGVGDPASPALAWSVGEPRLVLDSGAWAAVTGGHSGQDLWVRQVGTASLSDPLLLAVVP